jgi:hypothetical protein
VSKSSAPIYQRRTVIFQARDESSPFGFWLADGRKEKLRRGRYELSRLEIIKEPTSWSIEMMPTQSSLHFLSAGGPRERQTTKSRAFWAGDLLFFSTDAQISDACGRAWNSALLHFRQHGQHRSSVEERGRAAGARSLHCTPDE